MEKMQAKFFGGLSKDQLILNKKRLLVKKIENAIDELIFTGTVDSRVLSKQLVNKLEYNYTYMANVYSDVRKISLKRHIISVKVEYIKKLLKEDKYSITEIATMLQYRNVSHMSNQFKNVTGVTPSLYLASLLKE